MNEPQLRAVYRAATFGGWVDPPIATPHAAAQTLLGLWDDAEPPQRILLIGTAFGLEALKAAQRWPDASVTALEARGAWQQEARALLDGTQRTIRLPGADAASSVSLPQTVSRAAEHITWVAGDAHAPPFAAESFDLIVAFNLLDSVARPWLVAQQCAALLAPGGRWLVASPWTWDVAITPPQEQLDADRSARLRQLSAAGHAAWGEPLDVVRLQEGVRWPLVVDAGPPDTLRTYTLDAALLMRR